jgi:transaldolase
MSMDDGDAEDVLAEFRRSGVDDARLAARLQEEGIASFVRSWQALLECIGSRSESSEPLHV